ncbi:MAG: deoxyribose-phosphate aldolase [Thaumarchaeota archaeon]|jgi:deoxyribose-phosphate aldolase|nr:deoxyribose-phosphate aldolase [Candidatus Terraquivivens yellowstonensis]MCL7392793.1 deoxyribose-phosphate aldolase [Candidatus Terraquivivens yellowstonensis]MCL7395722.1 deoxyribose-phosphate aldolase [Candidatus Terraquivivens yellowstonensis]MCL7397552.1 deoxyribose-phosphate aldolase [Candidatus Terraquivivens yellowstonensis]MCL7400990.1 deoxyribose-phosphate aldolase [Candidatus Terraquivivens yellowstonensis]
MIGRRKLAKLIDHTDVRPIATDADIKRLCDEAVKYGFYAVCVQPYFVKLASRLLADESGVKVCTVVGFPFGLNVIDVKVFEARKAIEDGAEELDVVMNISAVKSGSYDYLEDELNKIMNAAEDAVVKLIIETGYLTVEEMRMVCEIAVKAGVDYIKTCTGFGPRGVSLDDVRLIKEFTGGKVGIKASGGIRTYEQAVSLIEAGATRLGTSRSLKVLEGAPPE